MAARTSTIYIRLAILWPRLYRLVCCYYAGQAARGGHDIEGEYAHDKCHREQCR